VTPPILPAHHLKIALVHPQIAPNTGNIARLCVATGTELHLVRPLGFVLSDRELRRSAMDYWPRLKYVLHDDIEVFMARISNHPKWLFSTKGTRSFWESEFWDLDYLVFCNETQCLPQRMLDRYSARVLRIPQAPDERCLNLSTAAGIGLYAALSRVRQG
jgi:tRNA (cytidine/uridine-2'-O-)-methyltransferase